MTNKLQLAMERAKRRLFAVFELLRKSTLVYNHGNGRDCSVFSFEQFRIQRLLCFVLSITDDETVDLLCGQWQGIVKSVQSETTTIPVPFRLNATAHHYDDTKLHLTQGVQVEFTECLKKSYAKLNVFLATMPLGELDLRSFNDISAIVELFTTSDVHRWMLLLAASNTKRKVILALSPMARSGQWSIYNGANIELSQSTDNRFVRCRHITAETLELMSQQLSRAMPTYDKSEKLFQLSAALFYPELHLTAGKRYILRKYEGTSCLDTGFFDTSLWESIEKLIEKCHDIFEKPERAQQQYCPCYSYLTRSLECMYIHVSLYIHRMNQLPANGTDQGVRHGNDCPSNMILYNIRNVLGILLQSVIDDYTDIHCSPSQMEREHIKNSNQILSNWPVKKFRKDNPLPDHRSQHSADFSNRRRVNERNSSCHALPQVAKTEDSQKTASQSHSQSKRGERRDNKVAQLEQIPHKETQTSGGTPLNTEEVARGVLSVQSDSKGNRENTPQTHVQMEQEVEEAVSKLGDQNTNKPASYNELLERYDGMEHKVSNVSPLPATPVENGTNDGVMLSSQQEQMSGNMDCGDGNECQTVANEQLVNYECEEVEQATKGFDTRPIEEGGHKLGAGSFAEVFYGQLRDADGVIHEVAVKRLKELKDYKEAQLKLRDSQFPTEVKVLTRYSHPNIVRLLGQCEGREQCLIFEYVPGPNLALLLAKDSTSPPKWPVRLKVLRDVADALKYLHTACTPAVVHRDVKSANILLTDKLEGKLADFGLSMLTENEDDPQASFCVSTAAGTRSYMPPEAFKGKVSPRVDIYSFGMVVYEIVTGLPSYSSHQRQDLVTYMRELIRKKVDLRSMLDPRSEWPHDIADNLMMLAADCTNYDSHKRPPMATVLSELEVLLNNHLRHTVLKNDLL